MSERDDTPLDADPMRDHQNSDEMQSGTGETGGATALMVRRPVLAVVISLLIVVAGLAGLYGAEIRELPDVDRPVINRKGRILPVPPPETVDARLTCGGSRRRSPRRRRFGPRFRPTSSSWPKPGNRGI